MAFLNLDSDISIAPDKDWDQLGYKNQIGEVYVIKQWRLLGLRAACLIFHSEVDAPASHLDRYYGQGLS